MYSYAVVADFQVFRNEESEDESEKDLRSIVKSDFIIPPFNVYMYFACFRVSTPYIYFFLPAFFAFRPSGGCLGKDLKHLSIE